MREQVRLEQGASRAGRQYVTLGIDREVFAVDVERVREILAVQPVSRLPNAPPYLVGMIEVRGEAVPLVDLRVKLGLPPVPPTENTRIVILDIEVEGRPLVLGLMADRVFEVTGLDSDVRPPPDIGVRWHSEYIRGVGRRGESFVVILDLGRLFSLDDAVVMAGSEGGVAVAPDEGPRDVQPSIGATD